MTIDLQNPTDQKFEFPAATSAVNESASIYLTAGVEMVGLSCPAMEANTAAFRLEVSEDDPTVADSDATWDPVMDHSTDATRVIIYGCTTARRYIAFSPDQVLIGPCRVRLEAVQNDGATAVNQDGQEVEPHYRQY